MPSKPPRCALICVGSELLRGKLNTHASYVSRRLDSIGLTLAEEHTVTDAEQPLALAIGRALEENEVVLVTGGLGPTFDDLTREAASHATGRPLAISSALLKDIQKKFNRARYRRMPPANKRQAFLLEGAVPISNRVGTAPGQWLALDKRLLILLPGPPSELEPMFGNFVLPRLRKLFPASPRVSAHLHFVGVAESVIDHQVRPIITRESGVDFTILAHLGLVDLDIYVSSSSIRKAQARLEKIVRAIRQKTGSAFYGRDNDCPLEKVVQDRFLSKHETLAVAESCTGGMLAKRLTDIGGSSAYFQGGIVSYSNTVKNLQLAVPMKIIQLFGAVSKEAAAAMARGVRQAMDSTWGIALTGIAGPTGGTAKKPVGLVYLGLSSPRGTRAIRFQFRGDRHTIRQRAVTTALDILRRQ